MKVEKYIDTISNKELKREIYFYNNDKVIENESYSLNKLYHREDGPATIDYDENGKKKKETYWLNGKLHRVGNPAIIHYYESGKMGICIYLLNNKFHRSNGPAKIQYGINGKILNKHYYLNGIEVIDPLQLFVLETLEIENNKDKII